MHGQSHNFIFAWLFYTHYTRISITFLSLLYDVHSSAKKERFIFLPITDYNPLSSKITPLNTINS